MNFFQFLSFLRGNHGAKKNRPHARPIRRSALLGLERLEDRTVPSANTISGFVYDDANNNGILDTGETRIANSIIELHDATGALVDTAVSDSNGFYQFTSDPRIKTDPATLRYAAAIPETTSDWIKSVTLPKFDTSLGTLTSVEIINQDPIKSTIKVENLSNAPGTITATVAGTLKLSGPGFTDLGVDLSSSEVFNAAAFDGILDFGGASGKNFGAKTASGSKSITLTSATDLALYTGTGNITLTETALSSSRATGSGNLVVSIETVASAEVFVIYHYNPTNGLKPGNYTLIQNPQPSGYLDGQDAQNGTPIPNSVGTDIIPVILTSTSSPNNNFGELKAASLSGFVYVDSNNDGVKQASEAGIGGVTVALTGTNSLGAVSLSATTGADGSYGFLNLLPGTYRLTESQPGAYMDGKDTIGSQGGTSSTNDQFGNINLTAGTNGVNNNFGELNAASLAGIVYADANNDGVKQAGETGIAGAKVNLTGIDDLGQAVSRQTTTGSGGTYQFTDLRPGTYEIVETQPSGYMDGKDTVGSQGGTKTNDRFSSIPLAAGVNGVNNNFGEMKAASLAGFVYVDANNNGAKNSGEAAIAGATVTLTGTDDLGSVSRTTTTGSDGAYKFSNLRPGTYTITESQPAAYDDGKDTIGSPGGSASNDRFANILLKSGVNGANNNFGEGVPTAGLAGFVYEDKDNDGVRDAGEPGIAGATVTLAGTNDLGQAVNLTQMTGSDGSYKFGGLRPGVYSLTEIQPTNYQDGKDTIGTPGGSTANDNFTNIVLTTGTLGVENNFGELAPASLAGWVYFDIDNNGLKTDFENGIGGVAVTLTGTNDLGPVSQTIVTLADGSYRFTNLRPGTYAINESQPTAYLDGKDAVGTQGGASSNDRVSSISLLSGMHGTQNNFGELAPAQLSGYVYNDTNDNGVKEASEAGIGGVLVTLTGVDDLGRPVNLVTTSRSDGFYQFTNLRPGTYSVTESHPPTWKDGKDTLGIMQGNGVNAGGMVNATVSNDQFSNISIQAGDDSILNNFGELSVPVRYGKYYWIYG